MYDYCRPVPRNEGQDRGDRSPPHQWHAPVFRSWTGLAPATPSCAAGMHPPRTVRLSCCSAWHGGPAIPSQAALLASVGVYACSCTCVRAHMLAASVECECGRASAGSLTPTLPLWEMDKGHHRPHCHWLPWPSSTSEPAPSHSTDDPGPARPNGGSRSLAWSARAPTLPAAIRPNSNLKPAGPRPGGSGPGFGLGHQRPGANGARAPGFRRRIELAAP